MLGHSYDRPVPRTRMATTTSSLFDRLRDPDPAAAWERVVDLYSPYIPRWVARVPGVGAADADDLTQQVMVVLVKRLPGFVREPDGSFRAWLREITVNEVRNWKRTRRRKPATPADPADGFLAALADPASDLSAQWDRDHHRHVFDKLLAAIRPDFAAVSWEAFRLTAIEDRSAKEAAEKTGLSENAVLKTK